MAKRAGVAMPLLASLLIAAAAAPAMAAPSLADARDVMRVVLAFETQVHRQAEVGPPPCVKRSVPSTSLGGNRRAVVEYERPPAPRTQPSAPARPEAVTVINSREVRVSPFFVWRHLAEEHKGYVALSDPLSPQVLDELRAAERAVMVAPRQRRLVDRIDPDWIGAPLAFCGAEPSWPYLEFGSPAFLGDFAFVSASFECVLCGQGAMLALRRSGSSWQIIAAAVPWVS